MKEFFSDNHGICYRASELRPDRPTLVFLHGLSGSSSAWIPYEETFTERFNVVTPDLRGHGLSRKCPRYADYEIKKVANDVVELLQTLGSERLILVGHSFGTLVALEILQALSTRVESVVFISPNFDLRSIMLRRIMQPIVRTLSGIFDVLPYFRSEGSHVDYSHYRDTGDWNARRIFADVRATSLRVYLYCLTQIYASESAEGWAHISVPTLVLHGKDDSIIPASHASRLSRMIPNSHIQILENANHILVISNVDEVARAINDFVS